MFAEPPSEHRRHSPYRVAPPRPPPPLPALAVSALIALGCATLLAYTSHKLYVMAELRGDIGALPSRELVVGTEVRHFDNGAGVYSLFERAGAGNATWQIQLTQEQAARHPRGAPVTVRCLEDECYMADSVYIDDGNRSIDELLLVIEACSLLACVFVLSRRLARWRAEVRATRRPAPRQA